MTKRELFQDKALNLIHQKGFKAMTMRELAVEMSSDIKNLYNYTSSKDALLLELLEGVSDDFHRGINSIVSSSLSAKQQIQELIRLHVTLSFEKPLKVGLLINEYRNLPEPHYTTFISNRDKYEGLVASIITRGINESEFRPLNVFIATQSILGSLRWQYDYYHQNNPNLNAYDIVEELVSLILPGLLAR